MPLEFETVAIPVSQGVNLTTPARLVAPTQLLEAVNSRFPRGAGATKRRGHYARRVRAQHPIPPGLSIAHLEPPPARETFSTEPPEFPSRFDWSWGFGTNVGEEVDTSAIYPVSSHPGAGLLFGAAQRDNETVLWDGWRLFSYTPSQESGALPTFNAVMPAFRSAAAAKVNQAQEHPDLADTGKIKVTAWLAEGDVYYMVQDSRTLAVLQGATALGVSSPALMRVMPVGNWVHILVTGAIGTLRRFSIHHDSPTETTAVSLGTCPAYFDAWKVNEDLWVVVRNDGNNGSNSMLVSWHYANGELNSHTQTSSQPDVFAQLGDTVHSVAIAVNPAGSFALVWRHFDAFSSTMRVRGRTYSADGTPTSSPWTLSGAGGALEQPVTVAPMQREIGLAYKAYFNNAAGQLVACEFSGTAATTQATRYRLTLASHAFRTGARTFVWAAFDSTYQKSFFLLDDGLLPVGRAEYTTANVYSANPRPLHSVNWHIDHSTLEEALEAVDPIVFHGALAYRARVTVNPLSEFTNTPVQYADPSTKHYVLDMVPQLRWAQAGRALYFAGAQLWSYDGLELVEAGFHLAPEDVTTSASGSGGGLSTGPYTYRVDLCYRNAHNEEVRSASFYTESLSPSAGQKVTLTIPTMLTRRSGAYFLIYRNEGAGTQWFLVNSRDPSSALFVENNQAVSTVTFLDDGLATPTDTELVAQEPHPGNSGFNYIDQFSAPACEIVAAGHDRLWVAGGELEPGQVLPSRLFLPTETPGWNRVLVQQVDRSVEPITAIGFVGETRAYFRRSQTYVQQGAGVDNTSGGAWEPVRLAYADVGALGQEGLALITAGLMFQSPAGIRLLSAGGGLSQVGQPVDLVARDLALAGTIVAAPDQEVRFYAKSGETLVFNYQYGIWSTWTINAAGATRGEDGLALVAAPNGQLWIEQDGLWTDDGRPYKHRVRFAWLRRGDLMDFQRVRRIGAIGECDPSLEHKIHVDVYYDEREFADEWFDWSYPDPNTQNTDTFGSETFGAGTFGDNTGDDE